MHVIEAKNIREALPKLVSLVLEYGSPEETRTGAVIALDMPVSIRYKEPKEHVLLNPVRDANPFFHLMEAIWMLAGRQDGAFLDFYIKDFSKLYGNNGIIMDSYGFRWRYMFHINQLQEVINQLRKTPTTRQAILQMWHPEDLRTTCAKPCNLGIAFRIVDDLLDMTVFNRSNDLIFGCCGANAVHFPILQEYIASKVGVGMGEYWQISTNLHIYDNHLKMLQKRVDQACRGLDITSALIDNRGYEATLPLMAHPDSFEDDLVVTVNWLDDLHRNREEIHTDDISNPFLHDVVVPMARAHHFYKKKAWSWAIEEISKVTAEDWKRAGYEWIMRRHTGASR